MEEAGPGRSFHIGRGCRWQSGECDVEMARGKKSQNNVTSRKGEDLWENNVLANRPDTTFIRMGSVFAVTACTQGEAPGSHFRSQLASTS